MQKATTSCRSAQIVTIAIIGKYTGLSDAYLSVIKSLQHACLAANRKLAICARSFKALPRPAQLLVDHLRQAATCFLRICNLSRTPEAAKCGNSRTKAASEGGIEVQIPASR